MYTLSAGSERRLLWLLALIQFTLIMDFMVMMPLGPQIMRTLHIGPAAFATAVSVYSWCSGLSGLFAATYIDRFDRRRLLLAFYVLFALSNLACATAQGLTWLLLARAMAGITGGVLGSLNMTIVGDVIPPERRGAATGVIMTAFSLAAVLGVPAGVLLSAHFGWSSPFYLLVLLSALIGGVCLQVVPSLTQHLGKQPRLAEALPALWRLLTTPRHVTAFVMMFCMMSAQMTVIPFISPTLVANLGVQPGQLSWLYMAGGAATLFTSRLVGRLTDRFGSVRVFRVFGTLSIGPILFFTHLPALSYGLLIVSFAVFMVIASSRIVPLQALMTKVPEPAKRGAFMSAASAVQSLGAGCGAWLGGLLLTSLPDGRIGGYGTNGWVATGILLFVLYWVARVRGAEVKPVAPPVSAAPAVAGEPVAESR